MSSSENRVSRKSRSWELKGIHISHNTMDYASFGTYRAKNDSESVRLHFGLTGSYDFHFVQLGSSFSLSGHHNNIMYTEGLELAVQNRSTHIETFGIDFRPEAFIHIGQNGNEALKRFTEQVINKQNTILSPHWRTNNINIQQVIHEILECPYDDALKDLFLLSKSIELLVLQADLYQQETADRYIKSERDRRKLIEAKELLSSKMEDPPTIVELSKLVGINEYKLKKGFKEVFGTTIFGYIHQTRMSMAKRLLLGTDKSAKEIAYETGYSSPQHFSSAFKKQFGVSPKHIRSAPGLASQRHRKSSNLDES